MKSLLLTALWFAMGSTYAKESKQNDMSLDSIQASESVLLVNLDQSEKWKHLKYDKIATHRVEQTKGQLVIKVDSSSGPSIYPFEKQVQIEEIDVEGSVSQLLKVAADGVQGDKKNDDFLLRVGLVVPGEKKLNWAQRQIAAPWILQLHQLAPNGSGLSHIQFFNAVQVSTLLGQTREHPLSSLIKESFVWLLDAPGDFSFRHKLDQPLDAVALWLAVDGDNTQTKFELKLNKIAFKIKQG